MNSTATQLLKVLGAIAFLVIFAVVADHAVPYFLDKTPITDGSNLTTEERIGVLHRLISNPHDPSVKNFYIKDLFDLTCGDAQPRHYHAIFDIFADSGELKSELLPAISTLFFKIEIERLKVNPLPKVTFPPAPPDLQFPNIPPPLMEAHQLALSIAKPFLATIESLRPKEGYSFQVDRPQWNQLITRFLQGDRIKAEEFLAFKWGSSCGMGIGSFEGPQSLMIFLSLVREERHAEALGAALYLKSGLENHPSEFLQLVRKYYSLFGLDVSKASIGTLTQLSSPINHEQRSIQNSLLELSANGGGKEALLLIELIRLTNPEDHCEYIITLGALLTSHNFYIPSIGDHPEPRRRLPPASEDVQREIIRFFDQYCTSGSSYKGVLTLVEVLEFVENPEGIIPILLKLKKSAYPDVAKKATTTLLRLNHKLSNG